MAKDLYNSRKMYQGPWVFFLIIPIGMIFCFWLFDVCYGMYVENKLKHDTKEILTQVMDKEGLESIEDYEKFAEKLYKEKGYSTEDMSISFQEDYVLLINYKKYLNMIGTVSFGLFHNENGIAVARYKSYYNEYKETVVEEYIEDETEDILEDEEDDVIILQ